MLRGLGTTIGTDLLECMNEFLRIMRLRWNGEIEACEVRSRL
jgi:hypothetical protein